LYIEVHSEYSQLSSSSTSTSLSHWTNRFPIGSKLGCFSSSLSLHQQQEIICGGFPNQILDLRKDHVDANPENWNSRIDLDYLLAISTSLKVKGIINFFPLSNPTLTLSSPTGQSVPLQYRGSVDYYSLHTLPNICFAQSGNIFINIVFPNLRFSQGDRYKGSFLTPKMEQLLWDKAMYPALKKALDTSQICRFPADFDMMRSLFRRESGQIIFDSFSLSSDTFHSILHHLARYISSFSALIDYRHFFFILSAKNQKLISSSSVLDFDALLSVVYPTLDPDSLHLFNSYIDVGVELIKNSDKWVHMGDIHLLTQVLQNLGNLRINQDSWCTTNMGGVRGFLRRLQPGAPCLKIIFYLVEKELTYRRRKGKSGTAAIQININDVLGNDISIDVQKILNLIEKCFRSGLDRSWPYRMEFRLRFDVARQFFLRFSEYHTKVISSGILLSLPCHSAQDFKLLRLKAYEDFLYRSHILSSPQSQLLKILAIYFINSMTAIKSENTAFKNLNKAFRLNQTIALMGLPYMQDFLDYNKCLLVDLEPKTLKSLYNSLIKKEAKRIKVRKPKLKFKLAPSSIAIFQQPKLQLGPIPSLIPMSETFKWFQIMLQNLWKLIPNPNATFKSSFQLPPQDAAPFTAKNILARIQHPAFSPITNTIFDWEQRISFLFPREIEEFTLGTKSKEWTDLTYR
jgi:hypothetical protein